MTPAEAGLQGACLEKPTRERAIQQYALAHELSPSEVTDDLLEKSELGMEGWACSGLDVNARGPVGNAMYRSFGKHPNMKETYKWLFDDLKRKFRCAWATHRNFDFVVSKRFHEKRESTKHQELGSFKSELQLQAHLGGVGVPEAERQAKCYIKNCEKWPEVFVKWNDWTEAYNYLLVEKLVTSTNEESWKDVVAMHDSSATFETESVRCKAMRKFAAFHNKAVESCTIEEVVGSPHGIAGWAEMQIAVPGVDDGAGSAPGTPAPNASDPKEKPKNSKARGGAKGAAKPKAKKELSQEKEAENFAKEMMCKVQKSQQIMDKILNLGDDLPSAWKWAKTFLQDYAQLTAEFKDALSPKEGDSLKDFVDELRLTLISPANLKTFKKLYGDRYLPLMLLFRDRCQNIVAQTLTRI
ncbi:unnamed protein product [Effrenium voratum]|uniref:Uncharacterized protein n=1 Tax=Effrenium voratum TaxID=2562239 RepID=A0AA36I7E7_9DINO|nr:unnamed protein product [Effrenium voratum]CAJ1407618.1 unnamed protein product [Effrenium voratum]CAJ1441122.1 unnamed protein product [Effrenium voratum]